MNEDLQSQINMGEESRRLLENPAFAEMFRRTREEVSHAWQNCDARDVQGQQLLLMQAKVLNHMENAVSGMVEQGKLAFARMKPAEISQTLGENPFQALRRRRGYSDK